MNATAAAELAPLEGQPHAGPAPSGAALRALTRTARRGHGGARWTQLFGDVYTYVFTAAVGIAVAFQAARVLGADIGSGSGAHGNAAFDPEWLVVVVALAVLGPALALLVRLGPVGVGAAGALWWLPTPADRGSLLRPTAWGWLAIGGVAGALVGSLVGALGHAAHVPWLALDGLFVGLILVAACILAQTGGPSSGLASGARARSVARVGDALFVVGALGWVALAIWRPEAPRFHPGWVAGPVVVLGVLLAIAAVNRVKAIPGVVLRTRGARSGEAASAVQTLDLRALGRVLTDAGKDSRRSSRSLAFVRGPVLATVAADALLLLRSPWQLTSLMAAIGLPLAVAASGSSVLLTALALVVGGTLAANASAAGARAAQHAPVLDRLLGLSGRESRLARLCLGSVVTLVWAAVVLLTLPVVLGVGFDIGWLPLAVVLAPGVASAGVIAAYRKEADWSKPLVVTPQGVYPPGIFSAIALGPLMTVLCLLPTAVALAVAPGRELPTAIVVVQAVISGCLLLGATWVRGLGRPGESGLAGLAARQERLEQERRSGQQRR